MSERTTIGGVSYESIGSSSSNLLLKCNGTARIQWGGKLIDLIKDGKIASTSEAKEQVFVVNSTDEITSDGVYVVTTEDSSQLWVNKNGTRYNLNGTDLYISATKKQNITGEQKQQAIINLGLYYDTIEAAKNDNIQNGLVYILNDKKLYKVANGVYTEFQASSQTVTVEKQEEEEIGKVINSPDQIVLSISELEHLIISNQRLHSNYSIYLKDSAELCSENASASEGYKLYMDKTESHLDVDCVSARNTVISPKISSENASSTQGFQIYTSEGQSYLDIDHINSRQWTPFTRGMIMMYSGLEENIPKGWAICDGRTYSYNNEDITTPNLVDKFIRGVAESSNIGETINNSWDNGNVMLTTSNLPEHTHPHSKHTHDISELTIGIENSGDLSMSGDVCVSSDTIEVVTGISSTTDLGVTTETLNNISSATQTFTGGDHTHTTAGSGTIGNATSTESGWQYGEQTAINVMPNYYALIFIMKL